jgi:hypothetical protein
MLAEAAGFAFLAAISPAALLVTAVFMSSANPRSAMLAYVAGAIVMSVAMAVVVLLAIRGAGLSQPRQHDPRYGLRLAVGVLGLAAAVVVFRRRPRQDGSARGIMSRLLARQSTGSAFAAGVILFVPSTTFIAAVQVIATASTDVRGTVLGLLVVVVIVSALSAWLPLVAYLLSPEATARRIGEFNAWLRARGRTLAAGVLAVGGGLLVINGALGLFMT